MVYYIVVKTGGKQLTNNSELFPYEQYPIRLEAKNTDTSTVCYFSCVEHLQSYIDRNKSKTMEFQIDYNTSVFSQEQINKMPSSTKPKKTTTKTANTKKTTTRTPRTKKTTNTTKTSK